MSAEEDIMLHYGGCSSEDLDCLADDGFSIDPGALTSLRHYGGSASRSYISQRYDERLSRDCDTCVPMAGCLDCPEISNAKPEVKTKSKEVVPMSTSSLVKKSTVTVAFVGSDKEYSYFTDIEGLKQGDLVVVDTMYGYKTANIVKVRGFSKAQRDAAGKWIVCKIDTKAFDEKLQRYALVSEIEQEIEEEMKSQARVEFYKKVAKDNPRVQELLTQLEGLISGTKSLEA